MRITKTLIYVNFAPYENAGYILDYILKKFPLVFLFSFDFHQLHAKRNLSYLHIYRQGKLSQTFKLHTIPMPESIIFLLLPIRSFLIFIQLLWYFYRLQKLMIGQRTYFTVNAFTAWTGNILRSLGLVDKTIFWVWDYYPPDHLNPIIKLMRFLYWQFDKAIITCDKLVFLNTRLLYLRQKNSSYPIRKKHSFVPIGTKAIVHKVQKIPKNNIQLVFIGVIKKSQGLALWLENAQQLTDLLGPITLSVVGSGPDLEYFKQLSKKSAFKVIYHGFKKQKQIEKILKKAHIGIATYIPEPSNVSYFGDPSKIKLYLSAGLPVITTNVFQFSKVIHTKKAGLVINYRKSQELNQALKTIVDDYSTYATNSFLLNDSYNYLKLYPELFKIDKKG